MDLYLHQCLGLDPNLYHIDRDPFKFLLALIRHILRIRNFQRVAHYGQALNKAVIYGLYQSCGSGSRLTRVREKNPDPNLKKQGGIWIVLIIR